LIIRSKMIVLAAGLMLAAGPLRAELPTEQIDNRTLRIQAKVESLYERGDYARARFIYENELAPIGDKYAQYAIGYMYLMGEGVPEDAVVASAWYRLAAERGAPEFVSVRDELMESLDDEELARSDRHYVDLRGKYSDLVIMTRLIEQDVQELHGESTGSRLPRESGAVSILDPRSGVMMSLDEYRRRIEAHIRTRLDFIAEETGIETPRADLDAQELATLWEQVRAHVAVVDDR